MSLNSSFSSPQFTTVQTGSKLTWFPNLSPEQFPVQTLSGIGLSGFQKGKDLLNTLLGTQTGETYTLKTDVVLEEIVIHSQTKQTARHTTHKLLSIPQNTREGEEKHWRAKKNRNNMEFLPGSGT